MTPEQQEMIDRGTMIIYGDEIISKSLENRIRKSAAIEILKIAKKCNLIYCSDKKCPMCVPFKNEMKKKFGVE